MSEKIRILICDDQVVVTEGLRVILGTVQDMQVVGVANDGEEAVELASQTSPDVILMDLKMPVVNGVQATRSISQTQPDVKILVLTTYTADEWVFDAIRAGAAGYLLKDTPRDKLIEAIRDTAAGKTPVDPSVAGRLFSQVSQNAPLPSTGLVEELSDRELEVLRLLAHGMTNADIAAKLFLSEGTVRNYVSSILSKLGVEDRTQAAVFALRHGIVSDDEAP